MNTKEKLEMTWKYLALILVAGLGFKLIDSHHNSMVPPFSLSNHDKNGFVFIGDNDGDIAKFGSTKKMDVKVEKEIVDGDTIMNVTVNGKTVDASKFQETDNEMKWTSDNGEEHIIIIDDMANEESDIDIQKKRIVKKIKKIGE